MINSTQAKTHFGWRRNPPSICVLSWLFAGPISCGGNARESCFADIGPVLMFLWLCAWRGHSRRNADDTQLRFQSLISFVCFSHFCVVLCSLIMVLPACLSMSCNWLWSWTYFNGQSNYPIQALDGTQDYKGFHGFSSVSGLLFD